MSAPAPDAQVHRAADAGTLVFAGALERAAVAGLWRQLLPLLAGARRFDLRAVERVDSAGLALLAQAAAQAAPQPGEVELIGTPPGLDELRTAYRLNAGLAFTG
ncbi:MAG: STAS domain-containing protein [Lysobacter sp.]